MSLRWKFGIIFAILMLISASGAGWYLLRVVENQILKESLSRLESTAHIQENRVNEAIVRYLEWVRLISSRTKLRVDLAGLEQENDDERKASITSIIKDAKSSLPDITRISILDKSGVVVASTFDDDVGLNKSDLESFKQGQRGIFLQDVFKDSNNRVQLLLVGPLYDDGELIGVLEVAAQASLIIALTEDYTGLGETGEFLLAKRNSRGDAVFLTPLRFDGGAALVRAIPGDNKNIPIIRALDRHEGVLLNEDTIDYRGERVIAVTRYLDALDWGVLVKIDRDEVLLRVRQLQWSLFSIIFASSILIYLIAILAVTRLTRPLIQLTSQAKRIANGDFSGEIIATGHEKDELSDLARAFNSMQQQMKKYYDELEKRVRLRTEEVDRQLVVVEQQNIELDKSKQATLNILEDLQAERKQLVEAKAKDEAVLASIGEGLVVTDNQGVMLIVNQEAASMLGRSQEDLVGKNWFEEVIIVDDQGKEVNQDQRLLNLTLLFGNQTSASDMSILSSSKEKIPVALTVSPVVAENRKLGGIAVFRDVSKEKEIDKAKTEFVSLASHQLRTPLSTINWYAEMLIAGDAGELTKEQKKYVEEIYGGNQRMVDLVNALLDVSRLELGTFSVEPEPTDIVQLSKEVVLELEPQIFKKKQELLEDYDELEKLNYDPKLTRIIFQNLLSNAVKYTPEAGKVSLSVKKDGENLTITVKDTGLGIPKSQQDKIFSKLFRADNVKQSDTTGTGLGLYIIKQIVDHSGGKVWFESVEDKGTTFYVQLPLSGMKEKEGTRKLGD